MKSSKNIVEEYLKQTDWRVKENSNSPYSFGGLNKYITAEVSKDYWLREVYNQPIAQAYVDGHIHLHDLGGLSLYCCGFSLKDILFKGVRGVPNIPVSAPAKHLDSILNQIANLTTVFQNEIMGAVAFNGFDTLLAPFIKQDNLSYAEVKQNIQNYIFSINSNSRAGAEPACSNLTFDLTPPEDMLNEYAVIGGDLVSFTYGSCQREMDMLNRAFFETMLEGDAEGKLFAYPIPTYNIHKRFDWDNPNNKMLWEMAGKYGTPYFANFINSDLDITDVRSMCPLSGDTKILYRNINTQKWNVSSIKRLYESINGSKHSDYVEVLANGAIIKCKINKFNEPANYTITLSNNLQITTTKHHLNKVYGKNYIETQYLTTDDYIPFYRRPTTITDNMSYEQGKLIGMFLGDGSINNTYITFSLNRNKKQHLIDFLYEYCPKHFNAHIKEYDCVSEISGKTSCVNINVCSKALVGLIKQFTTGNNALDKGIDYSVINTSEEFRRGIIDGLYETDGGNNGRIYTSSATLVEGINAVCASLGVPISVNEDNREGRLGKNTCYTVRIYTLPANKSGYGNVYKLDENYVYFKIKNIAYLPNKNSFTSYCLEVIDENVPEEFMLANGIVTHNCRLRLDLSELRHRNGGLFGAGDSTGSIGVVTINLPRLGYECKGNIEKLYQELDKYLDLAKESLEIKREWLQKNVIETNLIPAYMEYVGTLNNHFSTIGVLGYNEMCENFMGKNILDDEAHSLCYNIGEHIRNKLLEYQEETGHLFNYEATPAESTCYRFALIDKKYYPDIITQGSGKDCYYTNSCHIPVKLVKSINDTFAHQNDLQKQFTGGTVIHVWEEGAITGEQAKAIVKAMFNKYEVPYMSLSPISRYCDTHGYITERVDKCPICKSRLKKYQRITGYLRCVDNYNRGKAAEFKDRIQLDPTGEFIEA